MLPGVTASFDRVAAALADRYRLIRELGSGGMATVYLAEDMRHRRQVAVKVLRPELAATLGADRFTREIETVAQFQHPHILPLRSEEHTSELQSQSNLVCRLLLEKKKKK